MTRTAVGLLLLLPASLFAFTASAQDPREPQTCKSLSSASRTRTAQCGDEETTVETVEPAELEFTLTLERPSIETALCRATQSIEYLQIDTIARVSGVIDNKDCAASSGEYTLQARIRNESGETKTLEFQESWQRSDDRPVEFSAEYPIGENVELLRMRSSRLRCECAEPREEQEPTVQ